MVADGASVVVILSQLAGMARRLREAAEATGQREAAAPLAQIEASGLRLRDRWLHRVELRRR